MRSSQVRTPRRVLVLSQSAERRARLEQAVDRRAGMRRACGLPAEICLIDVEEPGGAARLARTALRAGMAAWVLCGPEDGPTAIAVPPGTRLLDRTAGLGGSLGTEYSAARMRQRAVLREMADGARDAEDVAQRLGVRRQRVVAALAAARAELGGATRDEVVRRGLRSTPVSEARRRAAGPGRGGWR